MRHPKHHSCNQLNQIAQKHKHREIYKTRTMKKANVYTRGTTEQTYGRTRHLWFEHKCGVRRVPKERCSLMSQFAQFGQPRHVLRAPNKSRFDETTPAI
jgi:hypothetical protein